MSGTPQSGKRQTLRSQGRRSRRNLARRSHGLSGKPEEDKQNHPGVASTEELALRDHSIERDIQPAAEGIVMAAGPHVKIPTFAGQPGESGAAWLKKYTSQCTNLYNYDEGKVNATFPYYLTGQAEAWYNSLPEETQGNPNSLREQFVQRFDGSDCKFSYGSVRQQTHECVSDYTTRFLKATNNRNMPTEWLVTSYIDGLSRKVRAIVKPQKLDSLEDARQAAVRAEHSTMDHADVSALNTDDTKMDQLLFMMSGLCSALKEQTSQRPPQRQPAPGPPQTYSRSKGRNGSFSSYKESNHRCTVCEEFGHFEQNCFIVKECKQKREAEKLAQH